MSSKRPGEENHSVHLHSNSTRLPSLPPPPPFETLIFKKAAADTTTKADLFGGGGGGEVVGGREPFPDPLSTLR